MIVQGIASTVSWHSPRQVPHGISQALHYIKRCKPSITVYTTGREADFMVYRDFCLQLSGCLQWNLEDFSPYSGFVIVSLLRFNCLQQSYLIL